MRQLFKVNFYFESCHRLTKGYVGKCQNLHGHSWFCELEIESKGLNEQDIAIDFHFLKQITDFLRKIYDHKTLICSEDKTLKEFLQVNKMDYVEFEGNPTCEVIANDIRERYIEGALSGFNLENKEEIIKSYFNRKFMLHAVKIKETANNTYTLECKSELT